MIFSRNKIINSDVLIFLILKYLGRDIELKNRSKNDTLKTQYPELSIDNKYQLDHIQPTK